ncbi:MAG: alanine--tRNA ligase [Nitrospinae bacterium]|nr:alanine--tRNA ligase [Nitrospinota bacterium]
MSGSEVRRKFLEYFAGKEHAAVRSAPLVPGNDPTLLFTNAGMVPFKDVFLGVDKRPYKRAVSAQKCLRVSGKHNDLETVGRTARHHTFFEMLGNFSFGDYFKEKAIDLAWEFMAKNMELPVEKLYITVYKDDDDAARIWEKNIGIPAGRIYRFGEKDNFWSMGDTGPCGPCSEIHYDRGEKYKCANPNCGIDCECDRFLELWNLVFMQYNRDSAGKLTPLPNPSIDTGMGLERLVSVIQGKDTNFDTDLILPVIRHMERIAERKYPEDPKSDISFRVIGDHARAVTFLLADGVMPSNEGRGYVLRRILRRALRHGRMLGVTEPFAHKLTDTVIETMKDAYPELAHHERVIRGVTLAEEQGFGATLEYGMNLIAEMIEAAKANTGGIIPGAEAFKLYDTYGFPMDLAVEIAVDANVSIDMAGFNAQMTGQREKARKSWKGGSGEGEINPVYKKVSDGVPPTVFLGYENQIAKTKVLGIVKKGEVAGSASAGDEAELLLAATPFYAESGGQVGDTGIIYHDSFRAEVSGVSKPDGTHWFHKVSIISGSVKPLDTVTAKIDGDRRDDVRKNHSATHLLHAALRQALGSHIKQAGSLVSGERLRFDYTHFTAPAREEIERVERIVNERVMENMLVSTEVKGLEEAMTAGATALFGEKYGDKVRVVTMGGFSQELCGGTHVKATGDIGLFRIVSEGGVAAGVRRIEAVTGHGALDQVKRLDQEIAAVAEALKSQPSGLPDKVKKLSDRMRDLEKENRKLKEKLFSGKSGGSDGDAVEVDGVKVLAQELDGADAEALRSFVDSQKNRLGSAVIVAASAVEGKAIITVGVTADLVGRIQAGKVVKEVAAIVGGGGGGRPDFAQAGGKNPEKIGEAVEAAASIVKKLLA